MPSPIWITKAGSLGVIPDEEFYQFPFEVYDPAQPPQPVSGKLSFDANRPSDNSGKVDARSVFGVGTSFTTELGAGDRLINDHGVVLGIVDKIIGDGELRLVQSATFTASDVAVRSAANISFKLISGELPQGLHIDQYGNISGIPINGVLEGVPSPVQAVTTSVFTVRATTRSGKIADRTFTITVAGVDSISLEPKNAALGVAFNGDYFNSVLCVNNANPSSTVTWKVDQFLLPPGITLTPVMLDAAGSVITDGRSGTPGGLLQGYFKPSSVGATETVKTYNFTVTASDGFTLDISNYSITIYNRELVTAGSEILHADLNLLPVSVSSTYSPVLYNFNNTMDFARQGNYYTYQFNGEDFNGDAIKFTISPNSVDQLPSGLVLNEHTGWIAGNIPYGAIDDVNYHLTIRISKADPMLSKYYIERSFVLPVVSQPSNVTTWITDSDLGEIENGSVSTLYVMAYTATNRTVQYQLASGRLPHGLSLANNGLIVGRASFEAFMLDSGGTTFKDSTTFDQTFYFTVKAYSPDLLNIAYKDFRIRVTVDNAKPYENLYIRALPERKQRHIYSQIINNTDIFPPSDLYRANDPWFGRNLNLRSLFLTGLNPVDASEYVRVMNKNHYRKRLTYSNVKTARALDENLNVKYEVVYVDLVDNSVTADGVGPSISFDIPDNTAGITNVYPNSLVNMKRRLTDQDLAKTENSETIGYASKSILPEWMTSRQENGRVLGFTHALVLCYTKPGKSTGIAYRVSQFLDQLKLVDFTIDRYEWDSLMTTNFENLNTVITDDADAGLKYLKYPNVIISTNLET